MSKLSESEVFTKFVVNKIIEGSDVRDVISDYVTESKYISISDIKSSGKLDNFFVTDSLLTDFIGFMKKWQNDNIEYYKNHFDGMEADPLEISPGKSYIKIVSHGAVNAFVDKYGNVYKPAGWQAPAKGVRYYVSDYKNISFDSTGGFLYRRSLPPKTAADFI